MRTERKRKSYSIKLLFSFLGTQAVFLMLAPEWALALALSTAAACGLGFIGFRRLDHPAPRPVLPKVEPGLLQLLGHTPEELVGKTVIGVTPVGVVFVRADGAMAEVNQRFAEIVGHPRDELIGRAMNEISLPEEHQQNDVLMADAVSGRRDQYQLEKRYRRKDGGFVWVDLSATILRDEKGRFLYAVAVVMDISERKRTEQALRESEQRFRTLAELTSDWFWEQDEQFRFSKIYGNAYQMGGLNPDELIGTRRWDRPNYAMSEAEWAAHRAALGRHESFRDFEVRVLDEHGGMNYMEVSGVPVFDDAGQFRGYRGTGRKVTERRRAEEALRESEARYASLVASMREGILVRERDGTISGCNPGAERIFGLPLARIVGHTSLLPEVQYVNPDGTPFDVNRQPGLLALTTGLPADGVEFGVVRPDGSSRWVVASARPLFRDGESIPHAAVVSLNDITERKRAEEQLRDSEARFRSLTELSSDWYWEQDENFRFIDTSIGVLERSGMTRDERIGRTRWEVPSTNTSEEQWVAHRADLQAHRPFRDFEVARIGGDGQAVHITTSGFPIFDAQGKFKGYRGVGRNITERKLAELALSEAKLRLEIALEGSSIAVWDNDFRTGEVLLSAGWAALLGEAPGPTRTSTAELMRLVHPDDLAIGKDAAARCMKGIDSSYSIEHRVRTRGSDWKWILSRGRVIQRNASGRALRMSGTNTDITERVEREHALQQSLSLLSATLEATADGILVVDCEGRIASFNRNFVQMWRIPDEILAARDDERALRHVLFQLREPEQFLARVRELYASADATSIDTLNFKDGRVVERYSSPQRLDRDVVGRVWSFRDVTARNDAEAALERMNEELERRVTERTAQLEASVKELEAFSYSVSHDLRAPLRAIDGYSQILIEEARGGLAADARMCLDKISKNARRMAELIDRLLAFARYSRAPLERRAIDLAALVQSVIDEQPRESREIEFSVAPLRHCLADAQLLRQVFGNLVSNAVKYTRPCEVARIEIGAFQRDGASVYFVRDNGVGFDMRYVHKLFGVFQRLHSEKDFEGTGAGLAIVQRIVARHGGRAWAEGEVGKGAIFYFTLGGEELAAAA